MKGAVQGLATITARMPVKNELAAPVLGALRATRMSARWLAAVNSKMPRRLIVMATKSTSRSETTHGL